MAAIPGIDSRSSDLTLDYMKLLIAQLQNQNPLEPMDNAEMTSQLAQISQLEQLEYVNQSFKEVLQATQLNQAAALIGKEVSFYNAATGATLSGPVSGVVLDQGAPLLQVGSHLLALSDLLLIGESPLSELTFADRQAAVGMLGKTVSYTPDPGEPALVGRVTEATVRNGRAYVTFGDNTVPLDDVTVVGDSSGTVSEADLKRAGSLLHRRVFFDADGDGWPEQGIVSAVELQTDGLYLDIGEYKVPLRSVLGEQG